MRKFLLMFLVAFVATVSYASSIDTLYVKPGDPINFELKVDTEKFPVLKGNEDSVRWYFNNTDDSAKAVALPHKVLAGKKYVDYKAEVSHEGTYFYGFKINFEKSATLDTIKYVHVYQKPVIKGYTINKETNATVYEGDTAFVEIKVENKMDAKDIFILNGEDTIAHSNDLNLYFIPSKEGKQEYSVLVSNPYDKSVNSNPRTVTMIPTVKLQSLVYFAQTGEDNYTKTTPNSEMNVSVLNHDSVNLIINTNAEDINKIEGNYGVTYTWNKDGINLPKGITVENGSKLIIPEYDKATMDGKYNCIISDTKTTFTVTFDVLSSYPTANEGLSIPEIGIVCNDGYLLVSNVLQKRLTVVDANGRMLVNKASCAETEQINVPRSTVLFITVDGKTIKTVSK